VVNFRVSLPQGKEPRYPLNKSLGGYQKRSGPFWRTWFLTRDGVQTRNPPALASRFTG